MKNKHRTKIVWAVAWTALLLCISLTMMQTVHAEDNTTDNSTGNVTNSTINITNNVPNTPVVTLTVDDNNIICAGTLSDPDNNTMNATLEWYKNGNLKDVSGYSAVTNVSDTQNKTPGTWYCRVRAYDGNYSAWGTSNTLTIPAHNNTDDENETRDNDDNDTEHIKGQALDVRYDHLACKVDFTNAQLDLFDKYLDANVSGYKQ
jgi:hypothetical protein